MSQRTARTAPRYLICLYLEKKNKHYCLILSSIHIFYFDASPLPHEYYRMDHGIVSVHADVPLEQGSSHRNCTLVEVCYRPKELDSCAKLDEPKKKTHRTHNLHQQKVNG